MNLATTSRTVCLLFAAVLLGSAGSWANEFKSVTRASVDPKKPGSPNAADPDPEPMLALVGGVITPSAGVTPIANGTLLIQGDQIAAMGVDVEIPADAVVVDVAGLNIMPGLIDVHSRLWMTPDAANDLGQTGAIDAIDGIDPFQNRWREVARQGITSVYVQPNDAGSLGGFGCLLAVSDGSGSDELLVVGDACFQATVSGPGRTGVSRVKATERLQKILQDAKEYRDEWKKYRESLDKKDGPAKSTQDDDTKDKPKPPAADSSGSSTVQVRIGGRIVTLRRRTPPGGASDSGKSATEGKSESDDKKQDEAPEKPEFDALKERLARLIDGEVPIRFRVRTPDDVRDAFTLADEFGLVLILDGCDAIGGRVDDVMGRNLPIVLGPWLESGTGDPLSTGPATPRGRDERRDRLSGWVEGLQSHEGRLAIATFGDAPADSKWLRMHAAAAVAAGMAPNRVLAAITSDAAAIAGAGDTVGVLRVGGRADVAVFAGDPLDPSTPVSLTIAGGKITHQSDTVAGRSVVAGKPESAIAALPPRFPAKYSIHSKRVLNADGEFAEAVLKIRDGRIRSVTWAKSDDMKATFDVGDAPITPGLVAPLVNTLTSAPSGRTVLLPVDSRDSLDPSSETLRRLAADGFLTVGHSPSTERVVAGQSAVISPRNALWSVTAPGPSVIVLSFESRRADRFPSSLGGQIGVARAQLRGAISPAATFLPAAAADAMARRRLESNLTPADGDDVASEDPARGQFIFVARSDSELDAALRLIEEFELRAAILGAAQLRDHLDRLVATNTALIVAPMSATDYDWSMTDVIAADARGVPIAISGNTGEAVRRTAALLRQAGMADAAALKALTITGAMIAGVDETAGRIQAGVSADLVVWSDSPLNLSARPVAVIAAGQAMTQGSSVDVP